LAERLKVAPVDDPGMLTITVMTVLNPDRVIATHGSTYTH